MAHDPAQMMDDRRLDSFFCSGVGTQLRDCASLVIAKTLHVKGRCEVVFRGEVVIKASDARPSRQANLFNGGGEQTLFDEAGKGRVEDFTSAGRSRWSDLCH